MGRQFQATVTDNQDPDELGRLQLLIPPLSGSDEPYPGWVQPRVPGGSAACGMIWIPPVDSVVLVDVDQAGRVRWSGEAFGALNTIPDALRINYPLRAGFSSPSGDHLVLVDDDQGAIMQATSRADPDGAVAYVAVLDTGVVQAQTPGSGVLLLSDSQAYLSNGAGDAISLDETDGIIVIHKGGAEYLALTSGVAALSGTAVQVSGGTVELGDGVAPATHKYPLTTTHFGDWISWLTAIDTFMTACAAAAVEPALSAAAIAFQLSEPVGVFHGKHTTSLAAGAPYLSTVVSGL